MKKILILLVLSSLFLSCNNDDDAAPVADATLNGSWNMETYVAFMDVLPVLEQGDVTWTFSQYSVTVVNNVHETYPYMPASGTYDLSLENGILSIEGTGSYHYEIEGNQLTMEHVEAEVDAGPIMTFSRN